MPKKIINKYGDDILSAIQRATARPEWAWPNFVQKHSKKWVQLQLVEAFLTQDASHNNYSPKLLFPQPILEALILNENLQENDFREKIGPIAFGFAGPRLWKFLTGDETIAFNLG